jgi:hypothetical protein
MLHKFSALDFEEREHFLKDAGALLPPSYKTPRVSKIMKGSLSFYKGWDYFEIETEDHTEGAPVSLIRKGTEIILFDWQISTLLAFNQKAPLDLSLNNAPPYVVFFFSHVRMKDGLMRIIQSYEDLSWREDPSPTVKKTLTSLLRPVHILSWDDVQKIYELRAHILFLNNLFDCRLQVLKSGEVRIIERTLLVEGMPVLDKLIE